MNPPSQVFEGVQTHQHVDLADAIQSTAKISPDSKMLKIWL
jgi:hypothetical protein